MIRKKIWQVIFIVLALFIGCKLNAHIVYAADYDFTASIKPGESIEIKNMGQIKGKLEIANSGSEYSSKSNRFDYIIYDAGGNIVTGRYKDVFNPYNSINLNIGERIIITTSKDATTALMLEAKKDCVFQSNKIDYMELYQELEVKPGTSYEIKNEGDFKGNLEITNSGDDFGKKENRFDYIIYDKTNTIKSGRYKDDFNPYSEISLNQGDRIVITVRDGALTPLKLVARMVYEFEAVQIETIQLYQEIVINPGTTYEIKNEGDFKGNLEITNSGDDFGKKENRFDYIIYDKTGTIKSGRYKDDFNPYTEISLNQGDRIIITVREGALTPLKLVARKVYEFEAVPLEGTQLYQEIEIYPGKNFDIVNGGKFTGVFEVKCSSDDASTKDNRFDYTLYGNDEKLKKKYENENYNPYKQIKLNSGEKLALFVQTKSQSALKLVIYSEVYNSMLGIELDTTKEKGKDTLDGISVYIDNKLIKYITSPVIEKSIIMLPIAETFEALGAKVSWDELDRIITIGIGGAIIRIPIDGKTSYRNNEPIELQTEIKIISEKSFAPVDFICKALDLKYEIKDSTVSIIAGSKWDTAEVINPIAYREVRYLPDTDQYYIRVDLNPLAGQKNEKDYPIVWLGVKDKGNWYYSSKKGENLQSMKPNPGSELKHIRYNIYEKYISADDLPRNVPLEFMVFVDGYNTIPLAEMTKANRVITPLPMKAWQVQYNWRTDELEVFAQPIYASETMEFKIYTHIYGVNGKDLYVEHDKNNIIHLDKSNLIDKNKYYRSWKLDELNLDRNCTYRIVVVVEGFEPDNSIEYSRLVEVFAPKVESFTVDYDNKTKKLKVNGIGIGITGKDSVYLKVGTNDKTKMTPVISANNAYSRFSGEVNMSSLNLSANKEYEFCIVIKDSNGKTVSTSGKMKKTLKNSADSNNFFLDYAGRYKTFDYTKDRIYSFIHLTEAIQDTDNDWVAAYNIRENFDLIKLLKGEMKLDEYSGYSLDYYKKAIIEIITHDSETTSQLLAEKVQGYVDFMDQSAGLSRDIVDQIEDMDLKAAKAFISKNKLGESEWLDKLAKGFEYWNIGIKYLIILQSTYEVKEDILDSMEIVAKSSGDELFLQALEEVEKSVNDSKGKLKYDERVKEGIEEAVEILYDTAKDVVLKKAVKFVPVLGWFSIFNDSLDLAFTIAGVDERMDNIYMAIHDGFIQLYANNAYIKVRKKKDVEDIRATGIIYLSAAKYGNKHYGKFLDLLKIIIPDKSEGDIDKRIKACYGKVNRIDNTLQLWLE